MPSLVSASSATLFLSPITGTYDTGEPIIIRVMVGTGGESANAVEGVLRYDPKEVEVVSIDRSASLLSSWTHEPSFDNAKGEILFAGSMSGTSSFSGSRGEILALTIRGLRSEETLFEFVSGSASKVYAADGTGGNLLSALTNGVYVFSPKGNSPELQSPQKSDLSDISTSDTTIGGEVLGASTGTPIISSTTHPDQTKWYSIATSSISWEVPSGVMRTRLALDKRPSGDGLVAYDAPKNSKEIGDISDGIWYVHATREWEDGHSDTAHYRLAIDTVPPVGLTVSEEPRKEETDPQSIFIITATDTRSGIDHYEISLDGGAPVSWGDDGSHRFRAPALLPGAHTVSVSALDRAGNRTTAEAQITVSYLATPVLARTDETPVAEGESIQLMVSSLPNATLFIAFTRDGGAPVIEEYRLDGSGSGKFTSALVATPGVYQVSATAKLPNGAISLSSDPVEITVESSFFGILKRNPLIPVMSIALILLLAGAWFFWSRFSGDGHDDEYEEDDGEGDEVEEETLVAHATSEHSPIASGALVLGPARKRSPSMKVTRL